MGNWKWYCHPRHFSFNVPLQCTIAIDCCTNGQGTWTWFKTAEGLFQFWFYSIPISFHCIPSHFTSFPLPTSHSNFDHLTLTQLPNELTDFAVIGINRLHLTNSIWYMSRYPKSIKKKPSYVCLTVIQNLHFRWKGILFSIGVNRQTSEHRLMKFLHKKSHIQSFPKPFSESFYLL